MSVKPQPKPTQPQSTQPKPNQAKPFQAKPSQPTPTQAKPTTPKPTGQAAPKVSLPKVAGPQTTALTKAPTPQPLGEATMTAMRNAKQLSTALRQGQTGQELIQKLHSMSPQEQKATLAAMQSSYPAVWKAYQQAKAEGAAPAKPSAAGPSSLDIAKAFGQSMVTETPANLVKFGQGVKQSGVELASGLLSAVKNPAAVAKAIGQQISQSNAKMAAGIYLAGVSSGLLKGNQQAAQDALKKLPAAQAQQAKQQLLSVLSDPKKIGNVTGNALLGVLSDGALSAAGKGVGLAARSATGQAATRTAQQAASAGNRALDSIAQGMFGGKGPKGMTPALATVGGGMSNVGAGLNLGRQVGQFPKGLGLAGVGAANLMAKGSGNRSATPKTGGTPIEDVKGSQKTPSIKDLAKDIRSLGNGVLRNMEDLGLGGHTIAKHVSKSPEYLIQRANREDVPAATSFRSQSMAEKAVLENIRNNADAIAKYIQESSSSTRPKAFTFSHEYSIGYGVKSGRKNIVDNLTVSEVIIKVDKNSPHGFIILTATAKMR